MALKTFNVDAGVYEKYSKHCRKKGISMSKQVENFLRAEIEKMISADGDEEGEVVKKKSPGMIINLGKQKEKSAEEHTFSKYCG